MSIALVYYIDHNGDQLEIRAGGAIETFGGKAACMFQLNCRKSQDNESRPKIKDA